MWKIILFLCTGIAIGLFFNLTDRAKKFNSNLQLLGLVLLLGSMGISIGANPQIMSNLSTIGFQSFLYALSSAVFCSIIGLILIKIVKRGEA